MRHRYPLECNYKLISLQIRYNETKKNYIQSTVNHINCYSECYFFLFCQNTRKIKHKIKFVALQKKSKRKKKLKRVLVSII